MSFAVTWRAAFSASSYLARPLYRTEAAHWATRTARPCPRAPACSIVAAISADGVGFLPFQSTAA